MSTVQSTFVTISCDGPGCGKTVTFPATEQGKTEAVEDYPWLLTLRGVGTPDQRTLNYCSDTCEANGLATGVHNKPDRKRVIQSGTPGDVKLAAIAAEQAKQANKALHDGGPVTLS